MVTITHASRCIAFGSVAHVFIVHTPVAPSRTSQYCAHTLSIASRVLTHALLRDKSHTPSGDDASPSAMHCHHIAHGTTLCECMWRVDTGFLYFFYNKTQTAVIVCRKWGQPFSWPARAVQLEKAWPTACHPQAAVVEVSACCPAEKGTWRRCTAWPWPRWLRHA
jgi:hypothetical protein